MIGAISVVTNDVPSYAVVVGNPGEVVKYRFPEEVKKRVEKSRWWNSDRDELRRYIVRFKTVSTKENLNRF